MRVFKTKVFAQFCRKSRISNAELCEALETMLRGTVDADLGGGVYKQRLAWRGQGKSGGFRVIVLLRISSLAMFAYGFAKNERNNIDRSDLIEFRELAKEVFQYDEEAIGRLISTGALQEICHE